MPAKKIKSELYEYVNANFDPEEIKRRKNSKDRRLTTAEVLAHLQTLTYGGGDPVRSTGTLPQRFA